MDYKPCKREIRTPGWVHYCVLYEQHTKMGQPHEFRIKEEHIAAGERSGAVSVYASTDHTGVPG